ncbi:MAG: hypothetical protein IT452_14850 [Planctomycetia bacterium]|nr:hypothetical protein [Planctomycetia bacterium]
MLDPTPPAASPAPVPDPTTVATRRAILPEVLLAEDVALAQRITLGAAQKAMRSGRLGPVSRVGRRLAILRTDYLEAIRGARLYTSGLGRPAPGRPRPEIVSLLARRRGGGR